MFRDLPPVWLFIGLLGIHWVGDFVLQSGWMATTKSKSLTALSAHAGVYTGTLCFGTLFLFGLNAWLMIAVFVVGNGTLHLITDFFTSRISARLWEQNDWHNFFVVIGFDQLIHQACLGGTMYLLLI